MTKKNPSNNLPLAALPTVFGVSAMSVYLWRQGTPTKDALLEPFTPSRLRFWAKKNGRPIRKDPDAVLAKLQKEAAKKAGRPPRSKEAKPVKRNGAGNVTSAKRKPDVPKRNNRAERQAAAHATVQALARQLAGGASSLGI